MRLSRAIAEERLDLKVADVMSRSVIVVDPQAPIRQVAEMMAKKGLSEILIAEDGRLIGIVTERDLVARVLAKGLDPELTVVKDVMSSPVISIRPDASIYEAIRLMRSKAIKRLVVLNHGGKIVGVITQSDIINVAPMIIDLLSEMSTVESPYMYGTVAGYCDRCGEWSDHLVEVDGMLLCENCRLEYLRGGGEE